MSVAVRVGFQFVGVRVRVFLSDACIKLINEYIPEEEST